MHIFIFIWGILVEILRLNILIMAPTISGSIYIEDRVQEPLQSKAPLEQKLAVGVKIGSTLKNAFSN